MDTVDDEPLLTDAAINERVAHMIGRACRAQLWLMFLDERGVMLPTLMPCDDLPSPLPSELAASIADMLGQATAGTPIESAIFVWERPGGPIASADDKLSASRLAWACADVGVPVRAQLISHDYGVRTVGPEEFGPGESHPGQAGTEGFGAEFAGAADGVFERDGPGGAPQAG